MTARIHKSFDLLTGLHFNGQFYVNQYVIDATFTVDTSSISEQNIAMERIKFFLHECLQHSVFVNQTDLDAIEKYTKAGMTVSTLPEEPYDQIIGIMLLTKLNSITEGRLTIIELLIESSMSDGVSCCISEDESLGPFYEKGWWNDSSQQVNDITNKNKKIVKLSKSKTEWQDVYLDWEEKANTTSAEIVFASFDKTDK